MTQQMYNPMKPALHRKAIAGQGGFTLVELLVASAGGLILMGFVAVVFSFYGRTVSENQAIIRMHDSMRSAAWKLRQDLEGITCDVKPWIRPEQDAGYFELIEGPLTDLSAAAGSTNLVADVDDVLMFTTCGNGSGFVGKHASSTNEASIIEADATEVVWFCVQQPGPAVDGMNLYSLHRRQLLVVGYVGTTGTYGFSRLSGDALLTNSGPNPQTIPTVFQDYDISLRYEGGWLLANGLSDLTKRENRFLHRFDNGSGRDPPLDDPDQVPYHIPIDQKTVSRVFPYDLNLVRLQGNPASVSNPPWPWNSDAVLVGDREGEDVVIRNVLAFDVRVFDPQQAVDHSTGAVLPPDYTDLGAQSRPTTAVGVNPIRYTTLSGSSYFTTPTYCTWSYHYEFDGLTAKRSNARLGDSLDNNGDGQVDEAREDVIVDEGTDLLDNNGNGAIDETAEFETSPPYNVPLRGIEIRLRCYEPQGKQVRQVTIRHAF